jgi:hypothetical protein
VATVLVAVVLTGCGVAAIPDRIATSPEVLDARGVLDNLARRDIAAVVARMDESQRTPDPTMSLRLMADSFPAVAPTRVRVVGFNHHRVNVVGGSTSDAFAITFESNYPQTNVLSQVLFQRVDGGDLRILGLHASLLPAPLATVNAFTLSGKGAVHYAFLLIMAGVVAVTLVAVRAWVRVRRSTRHRWWWLAGILVGAFKISLDWTTGSLAIQALTVQLLSVGCVRSGIDGPWTLAFSIPAGAIAFLIVQRQARAAAADAVTPADGR